MGCQLIVIMVVWDKCVTFLDFISTVPLENPVNNPIIHNLLFDSSLIVWERIGDVYRSLISSNSTAFRPLIGSSKVAVLLHVVCHLNLNCSFWSC